MYRVLLPIDRNERRAAAQARAVLDLPAGADEIGVTLLHVVGEREDPTPDHVERMAAARTVADLFEAAGVDLDRTVRSGDPAEGILAAAAEIDADLIAIAGGAAGIEAVVFGSVAQDVLDRADRPVLVVDED